MMLYRKNIHAMSETELSKVYNKYVDIYNKKAEGKYVGAITFSDLKQTMHLLKVERKRQMQRRYNFAYYSKAKAKINLKTIVPGMYVSFREDGERHFGIVQKVCAKTFIINEDSVQWQIDAAAVRPIRRIKKNKFMA